MGNSLLLFGALGLFPVLIKLLVAFLGYVERQTNRPHNGQHIR